MEDREIVELYLQRSEEAIGQTKEKYGVYLRRLAALYLRDDRDGEECVSDVCFEAWNTIPPQKPTNLKAYLAVLCRRISIDRIRRDLRMKRGGNAAASYEELDEYLPDIRGEDLADTIALRQALNRFVSSLPKDSRAVFVQKYFYLRSVSEIAEDRAMKENTVKSILLRTRKKLKAFLKKEGFIVDEGE